MIGSDVGNYGIGLNRMLDRIGLDIGLDWIGSVVELDWIGLCTGLDSDRQFEKVSQKWQYPLIFGTLYYRTGTRSKNRNVLALSLDSVCIHTRCVHLWCVALC